MTTTSAHTRTSIRVLSVVALIACAVPIAVAADWPTFKPGQWTFDRTMTGADAPARKVSASECTDPTADQKEQQAMLAKAGCQFTPLTQSGKTYRYSATCKMAGMTTTSNSVLEVESAEAYTITVDSTVDGDKTHEVLRARRTGTARNSHPFRRPRPPDDLAEKMGEERERGEGLLRRLPPFNPTQRSDQSQDSDRLISIPGRISVSSVIGPRTLRLPYPE